MFSRRVIVRFARFADPPPFPGPRSVLVDPDKCGVNHVKLVFKFPLYVLKNTRPHTGVAPPVEAVINGCVRTIARRHVLPGRTGPQDPE